jgi:hypothetical protein
MAMDGRQARRRHVVFLPFAPLGAAVLAGCGFSRESGGVPGFPTSGPAPAGAAKPIAPGALIANPAKNEWPQQFLKASAETQEAYRYALTHPEVLQYMPCFCGCVDQGHKSNKDCYIQQALPDGAYELEPMSFG